MRNKSLFLLLACVCGTVAAIGVSQWMQANQGKGTVETAEIFVTKQAIGEREEITADKIQLEPWPKDRLPQGAINDLKELEGRFAKQALFPGEPILQAKLMNEKDDVIVPKGYSVVTMRADREGSAALLTQGDRVDVRAYFKKSDIIPRAISKTILSGVRVFAIDGQTSKAEDEPRRGGGSARTISLLIRKADEDAWTYAQKQGEIDLTLGSAGDYENADDVNEPSDNAKTFLTWLEDLRAAHEASLIEDEEPTTLPTTTPTRSQPKKEKKETWRITKMHQGRMVVYEFEKGNPVPRIVHEFGVDLSGDGTNVEEPTTEPAPATSGEDGLDYLNGQESPFFEPPSGSEGIGR